MYVIPMPCDPNCLGISHDIQVVKNSDSCVRWGFSRKNMTFAYQFTCYLFLLLCHQQNCNKFQKMLVQYSIIILYWPNNFFNHAHTYGMTTNHHGVIVFTIETSHREPHTKRMYKRSSGWNIPSIQVLKVHIVIYLIGTVLIFWMRLWQIIKKGNEWTLCECTLQSSFNVDESPHMTKE